MKLRPAQLCKKATFQALKKCFLHTSLMKLRPAQLCKKTTFQALENPFFAASCQICQLHLVTSLLLAANYADACNTKLRTP